MRRTPKRSNGLPAGHDAGTALNDESFAAAEPAEGLHRPAGWDEELPVDEAESLDEASAATEAEEDPHAPDDALGLYLRQMGAIPLLTREQELALAVRLETKRRRYRHAALSNWRTLDAVVETFEKVQKGQLALDPSIDVVTTLHLTRENILKRMPYNLRTMRHLLDMSEGDFRVYQRTTSASGKSRLRREGHRRLRKAVKLAEELSPRIDLLDRWTDELRDLARQMENLDHHEGAARSAAERERRAKQVKQLRD